MKKGKNVLLTAGLVLAILTLTNCGEVGCDPTRDSWCEENDSSSSIGGGSSSSGGGLPLSSSDWGQGNGSLDGTWQKPPLTFEINGTVAIFYSAKEPRKGTVSIDGSIFSFVITHVLSNGQWIGGNQSSPPLPLTCNYVMNGNVITFSNCSSEYDTFHEVINGVWTRASSGDNSSSSGDEGNVVYGEPVNYGGETYPTVVIGTQTWFAKNLNYNVEGSKCYDNDPANCTKYGRLYDWSTALTICPSGWHLPSDAEWTVLMNFVGSSNAGTKLKAKSGWDEHETNGNGTDNYGFSALPGGIGYSDGRFSGVGGVGLWWSTSEHEYLSSRAYFSGIDHYDEDAYLNAGDKSGLLSVRCVKD
jgi:uncharacterized protein (TIGR02145 family)